MKYLILCLLFVGCQNIHEPFVEAKKQNECMNLYGVEVKEVPLGDFVLCPVDRFNQRCK